MRVLIVAGFLAVALFVAVLGAIGAQLPALVPVQETVGPAQNVTHKLPAEPIADWRRG